MSREPNIRQSSGNLTLFTWRNVKKVQDRKSGEAMCDLPTQAGLLFWHVCGLAALRTEAAEATSSLPESNQPDLNPHSNQTPRPDTLTGHFLHTLSASHSTTTGSRDHSCGCFTFRATVTTTVAPRLSTGRARSPWPKGRPGPALRLRAKGQHQLEGRTRSDPGQARPWCSLLR